MSAYSLATQRHPMIKKEGPANLLDLLFLKSIKRRSTAQTRMGADEEQEA